MDNSINIGSIIAIIVDKATSLIIALWLIKSQAFFPKSIPNVNASPRRMSSSKNLMDKRWFVLLCLVFVISMPLFEVFSRGELTKMSVLKISVGVGMAVYISIQTSITRSVEVLAKLIIRKKYDADEE